MYGKYKKEEKDKEQVNTFPPGFTGTFLEEGIIIKREAEKNQGDEKLRKNRE
ncbi:MAG: hypothetical protein ACP5D6_05255 [Kosmotogaceae bacterium]